MSAKHIKVQSPSRGRAGGRTLQEFRQGLEPGEIVTAELLTWDTVSVSAWSEALVSAGHEVLADDASWTQAGRPIALHMWVGKPYNLLSHLVVGLLC